MPENLKSSLSEFNADVILAGYHWRKQNWGTKWNAYGNIQWDGNSISFKTAWNGVPELIRKLSLKFPDVNFHYGFSSENLKDQIGNMVFYNGIYIYDECIKDNLI